MHKRARGFPSSLSGEGIVCNYAVYIHPNNKPLLLKNNIWPIPCNAAIIPAYRFRAGVGQMTLAFSPPQRLATNDTLLTWCGHLWTVPVTTEPSRHTSRGQRLSAECSPIESRRSVCLARFRKEIIRRKQGRNVSSNTRSPVVSYQAAPVVWLPPWGLAFLCARCLGLVGGGRGKCDAGPER